MINPMGSNPFAAMTGSPGMKAEAKPETAAGVFPQSTPSQGSTGGARFSSLLEQIQGQPQAKELPDVLAKGAPVTESFKQIDSKVEGKSVKPLPEGFVGTMPTELRTPTPQETKGEALAKTTAINQRNVALSEAEVSKGTLLKAENSLDQTVEDVIPKKAILQPKEEIKSAKKRDLKSTLVLHNDPKETSTEGAVAASQMMNLPQLQPNVGQVNGEKQVVQESGAGLVKVERGIDRKQASVAAAALKSGPAKREPSSEKAWDGFGEIEVLEASEPDVKQSLLKGSGAKLKKLNSSEDFIAQKQFADQASYDLRTAMNQSRADKNGALHGEVLNAKPSADSRLMSSLKEAETKPSGKSKQGLTLESGSLSAPAFNVQNSVPFRTESSGAHVTKSARMSMDISQPQAMAAEVRSLATKGGGSVRLRIVPENLGEMTISVNSRGGALDIRFDVANGDARDLLMQSMPELRKTLGASQFSVGSIEVGMAQSAGAFLSAVSSTGTAPVVTVGSYGMGSFDLGQGGSQTGSSDLSQNSGGGSAWERYQAQLEQRYPNRELNYA